METKGNKKTKIILAVLSGLLVVAVAVIAFVLVSGKMQESNYKSAVAEGEKYLAANDYEQAIVAYENAISIDPDKDEAYLALAEIYADQGNVSRAKSILRKGYRQTDSVKIRRMLSSLETQSLTAKTGDAETEIDLAYASQDISWDTSFVQKIVNYTFDDFKDEFGSVVSAEIDDEGYLEIRHEKLSATFFYKNTSDNREIVDTSKKTPYASGMPEKVTLDSIGILFRNFDGGASLNRMQMLFGERVQPQTLEGTIFIENEEEDLVVRLETDSDGNITSSSSWNEIILPLANTQKVSAGTLEGVVVDAVSGNGVSGATITFEPENSSHDTVTETTDSNGAFSAELEPDDYEITIEAQGYIAETFTFTIEEGESYSGEQFVISPELSGEARIVLEWGAEPADLDSHLQGETDGGDNIHVYFADKTASSGSSPIADLDLDDMDGYGPETTTIYDLNGVYTFSVIDFRSSGTMAQNGATVKIYLPGQDPVVIELDESSGVDNVWTVCRIDHGKLEILDNAGSESDF